MTFVLLAALAAQAAAFDRIALDGGGEVIVRRGARAEVVLREGDRAYSHVEIADGRLSVRRCARHCPRGYRLRVDVTAPAIAALAVSNGGRIRVDQGVPASEGLSARIEQGGAIDLRALRLGALAASVASGGQILARVDGTLDASVDQGGQILYWGRPRLRHAIRGGGVVAPGRDGDLEQPLGDLHPRLPPAPPRPPRPPQ